MYEDQTYEDILDRLLDRVSDDVDKRPGSVIYDALAPAAAEIAQMYIELGINTNLAYADTATGEYLERRTAEFGITREPATYAQRKGLFYRDGDAPLDVPIGSRFSLGEINFTVKSKIAAGQFVLEADTLGTAGNEQFGPLLPIDYVDGLVRAELADVLVPGEEAEDDETLRQRYYEAVNAQPFGGNVSDYRNKIGAIPGVGGVKVYPVWQGGGTVKATIISSDYGPPSTALIDEVQTLIDPETNHGEGLGYAPIGHTVTITGVTAATVNVETKLTLAAGTTIGQVQSDIEEAIKSYLLSLLKTWKDQDKIIVRIAQIEARMLNVSGIVDVTDTKLNGSAANVELGQDEIPVAGKVTLNE